MKYLKINVVAVATYFLLSACSNSHSSSNMFKKLFGSDGKDKESEISNDDPTLKKTSKKKVPKDSHKKPAISNIKEEKCEIKENDPFHPKLKFEYQKIRNNIESMLQKLKVYNSYLCYIDSLNNCNLLAKDNFLSDHELLKNDKKLKKFIKKFADSYLTQLRYSFKNLKSKGEAEWFVFSLEKLLSIEKDSPKIFAMFPEDIKKNWEKEIKKTFAELDDKKNALLNDKDLNLLKSNYEIVKSLRGLDDLYIKGDKFTFLFKELENLMIKWPKDDKKILEILLVNHDYFKASHVTDRLLKGANEVEINMVQHEIKTHILKLIKDTKYNIHLLKNINELKLQSIADNLNAISKAGNYVYRHLSETGKTVVSKQIEKVEKTLSAWIEKYLKKINKSMRNKNFEEVEKKSNAIDQLRLILGDHLEKSVIEKITSELKNAEIELGRVVKKYKNKKLVEYLIDPPKDLCKILKENGKKNNIYLEAYDELKNAIVEKFEKRIEEIQKMKTSNNDKQYAITMLFNVIKCIPVDIETLLQLRVQNLMGCLDREDKRTKEIIAKIADGNDIKVLKQKREEFEKEGQEEYQGIVENEIRKNANTYFRDVENKLNKGGKLHKIENELYDIILYNKNFSDVNDISKIYNSIKKKLNKKFNLNQQTFKDNLPIKDDKLISASESKNIFNSFDTMSSYLEIKEKLKNRFSVNSQLVDLENDLLPSNLIKKFNNTSEYIYKFSKNNQKNFNDTLKLDSNIAINNLSKSLNNRECLDQVFKKAKEVKDLLPIKNNFLTKATKETDSIERKKEKLEGRIIKLEKQIELRPKGSSTFNEKAWNDHYEKLNRDLETLKDIDKLKKYISPKIKIEKLYKDKIDLITNETEEIAIEAQKEISKEELSNPEFNKFNQNLDILNSIKIKIQVPKIKIFAKKMFTESKNMAVKIVETYSDEANVTLEDSELVAEKLTCIKKLSQNIPRLQENFDLKIDKVLKDYRKKNKEDTNAIVRLGVSLKNNNEGLGDFVIAEHKMLKGYKTSLLNEAFYQRHGIDYVLDKLRGDDLDKEKLGKKYEEFRILYEKYVKDNLKRNLNLQPLVSTLIHLGDTHKVRLKKPGIIGSFQNNISGILNKLYGWDSNLINDVPKMMSLIFAIWTLNNSESFFECSNEKSYTDSSKKFLFQPHAGQIISIFRVLGMGFSQTERIVNSLAQIGTGEGKSITLAVTSIVLALLGFDVNCACYSSYLSKRDYNAFSYIFDQLKLIKYIKYGTFPQLCENVINEDGDIRNKIKEFITNNKKPKSKNISKRPKILLVDEVDVFFSKEFFGNLYPPLTVLKNQSINNIIDFVWQNRNSNLNLFVIKRSKQFKNLVSKYRNWKYLIIEAIKDMIADVKLYENHDYLVHNYKIGYKYQDTISHNISYGYQTIFAYYHELENPTKGEVRKKNLEERLGIELNSGYFSYAELPQIFDFIMGVTGTLETLSDAERENIRRNYKIELDTFLPCVFGENRLTFSKNDANDLIITDKNNFHLDLLREIEKRREKYGTIKRPVIVFFESRKKMLSFYNSKVMNLLKENVQLMTETDNDKEKNYKVGKAATVGVITFSGKIFGRGTDFVCADSRILKNGGVHVVCTFFPEELSEETQIKGRTARQGKDGSFSMILISEELEKFGVKMEDISVLKNSGKRYDILNDKRNALFNKTYKSKAKAVENVRERHVESIKFLSNLNKGNFAQVRVYLNKYNKGTESNCSKTLCLMDATGSMGGLLSNAKDTVFDMFKLATDPKALGEGGLQMQFGVYRNYGCDEDSILQYSSWESKPDKLRIFMDTIHPAGGWGREAIEIGLWHANEEQTKEHISQVIIIGDAAANTKDDVNHKRQNGQEIGYWGRTKFRNPTYWETELAKLQNRGIKVHAFYLKDRAKNNFQEIANRTGGQCEVLSGADQLVKLVLTEVIGVVKGRDYAKGFLSDRGYNFQPQVDESKEEEPQKEEEPPKKEEAHW